MGLQRAAHVSLVMADDLSYEYGVRVSHQIVRRAERIRERLRADRHPEPRDITADIRQIVGWTDRLENWHRNYVRGAVTDQPNREVLECKD